MAKDSGSECTKPLFMAGAGRLASTVWKVGDDVDGFAYSFNLFVLDPATGCTGSRFEAGDLPDFVKLAGVLAAELASDGWMSESLRHKLRELAEQVLDDEPELD